MNKNPKRASRVFHSAMVLLVGLFFVSCEGDEKDPCIYDLPEMCRPGELDYMYCHRDYNDDIVYRCDGERWQFSELCRTEDGLECGCESPLVCFCIPSG